MHRAVEEMRRIMPPPEAGDPVDWDSVRPPEYESWRDEERRLLAEED